MRTLQQRLRQWRSWHGKTLLSIATELRSRYHAGSSNKTEKNCLSNLCKFEQEGNKQAFRSPVEHEWLASAYGLPAEALKLLLDEEYDWRISYGSGDPLLPRMANYIFKPLPDAAANFFKHGQFCVLDLETTGKDQHAIETEIVDIAILDEDGLPLLNTLIRPSRPIPPETSAIHGIDDPMVANAPLFIEIYPQLAKAIAGKVVAIYNADYDAYLLDKLFIQNGLDMPDFEQYCLMKAYADFYKAPGKYGNYAWQSLGKACEQQHVELTDAHRALGDTLATWQLLRALAEKKVEVGNASKP